MSDFSWNFMFFRHQFSHRFFHWFLMENGSQKAPGKSRCEHQNSYFFATLSFMLIYVDFMLNLAQQGRSFLASFRIWAHFWCPLPHFGCPWRSIFSRLVPPGVILHIFSYLQWKSHVKSYFLKIVTVNQIAISQRISHVLQQEVIYLLYPIFQGPERNICLWQLRLIDIYIYIWRRAICPCATTPSNLLPSRNYCVGTWRAHDGRMTGAFW